MNRSDETCLLLSVNESMPARVYATVLPLFGSDRSSWYGESRSSTAYRWEKSRGLQQCQVMSFIPPLPGNKPLAFVHRLINTNIMGR
jgi:hypothetical protein